jgi:CheY-like chemotaxis protein
VSRTCLSGSLAQCRGAFRGRPCGIDVDGRFAEGFAASDVRGPCELRHRARRITRDGAENSGGYCTDDFHEAMLMHRACRSGAARHVLLYTHMNRTTVDRLASWAELPMEPPHARRCSRPSRVLVAEDDDEMRRLVVEALQKEGYEVIGVPDGNHLLIRITSHYRLRPDPEPIDLIVTDIRMPVVSGLDIVQSLRDAGWTTPVVIMTAFGNVETRLRANALGAVLLDKPFELDLLRTVVRNLLPMEGG